MFLVGSSAGGSSGESNGFSSCGVLFKSRFKSQAQIAPSLPPEYLRRMVNQYNVLGRRERCGGRRVLFRERTEWIGPCRQRDH